MSSDNEVTRRKTFSRRKVVLGGLGVAAAGVASTSYFLGRTDVRIMPGRSRARAVQSSGTLPRAVDVVVIGGGIVGTMAAFTLAERGVSVALCEKGVIAGEASGRAMGFIYSHYEAREKADLLARSKALWEGLAARLGNDASYRRTGIVGPLDSEEERAGAAGWLASMQGAPGFDGRIIPAQEVQALFPGMIDPPPASLYTANDGAVEPTLAAPAIADGARARGAAILQGCAVRGVETRGGRIAGVVTEQGPIACQAVALAGGAWTPLFAASLGIPYSQVDLYLSMAGLAAMPGPQTCLSSGAYGLRKRPDGSYSFGVIDFAVPLQPATFTNLRRLLPMAKAFMPISHLGLSPSEFWRELRGPRQWPLDQASPFEARRILAPAFRSEPIDTSLAALKARFPAFQAASIRERWAGVLSTAPDNMPVLSAVAGKPGLYVGGGFANGITYGPAAGEALADLATGRTPAVDISKFRISRFGDGSELRLY